MLSQLVILTTNKISDQNTAQMTDRNQAIFGRLYLSNQQGDFNQSGGFGKPKQSCERWLFDIDLKQRWLFDIDLKQHTGRSNES